MTIPTIETLFEECIKQKASDMYLTVGCPPSLRINESIIPVGTENLTSIDVLGLLRSCLSQEMLDEFEMAMEYNTSISWNGLGRFRINIFKQRQSIGAVIRRIETNIPTPESLYLPKAYSDIIMESHGLVLVVGPAGSGKSTSLAAMIGHRNRHGSGHIITVEDPVEFVHRHEKCIITQRDVGVDTLSFGLALKNVLRQRPDIVVVGEIRDRETVEHALNFAETGHLCLATLHTNSAAQAVERIVNLFPEEKSKQVLQNLSLTLRAIFSQRLVTTVHNTKVPAIEIMLNEGFMRNLIAEGRIKEMYDLIDKNKDHGMRTLDQSLLQLFADGLITEEMAVSTAHNPADVRLQIKQGVGFKRAQAQAVAARAKQDDAF